MRNLCRAAIMAALLLTPAALPAQDRPYQLPGAIERELASPSGDIYRLFIHVPDTPAPAGGFPVLYVLDGEDNFPIAVATARRLARAGARSGVGSGIVVGIDNGGPQRRARDYTPRFDKPAIREGQPGYGLPAGDADHFLDFIQMVLQPALMRQYTINPARTAIAGHSFGGVLVLHALIARPSLFTTYIAASPSLWLADGQMLNDARRAMPPKSGGSGRPIRLIITVGEKENSSQAFTFAYLMNAKGVDTHHRLLSGEDHGSSMAPTITDAVRAAFQPQ